MTPLAAALQMEEEEAEAPHKMLLIHSPQPKRRYTAKLARHDDQALEGKEEVLVVEQELREGETAMG